MGYIHTFDYETNKTEKIAVFLIYLPTLISPACKVKEGRNQTVIPSVKMNTNVSLPCPLFGFPPPVITWNYPNGSNETYRFTNILHFMVERESDIGTYYCSGCGKTFSFELEKDGEQPSYPPNSSGTVHTFLLDIWHSIFCTRYLTLTNINNFQLVVAWTWIHYPVIAWSEWLTVILTEVKETFAELFMK